MNAIGELLDALKSARSCALCIICRFQVFQITAIVFFGNCYNFLPFSQFWLFIDVVSARVFRPIILQVIFEVRTAFDHAPFFAKEIVDVPFWLLQADTIFFESSVKQPLSDGLSCFDFFGMIILHILQTIEKLIVAGAMSHWEQMWIELVIVPRHRWNRCRAIMIVLAASISVLHNSETIWAR